MLRLSIPNIGEEAIEAVAHVIRSGQLVHGPESEFFEAELVAYLGCKEAILVSSGTAALHLALVALNIGPGDAVLVPDFTFPATANAVKLVGATPVMIDVKPGSYCIDLEKLHETIKQWEGPQQLRAIIPVHEFGYPVDMTAVTSLAKNYDLIVIEDAACALGATHNGIKVGTFGQVGCFSFHPRKTLTTGEGGLLVTNDSVLAARMRRLRSHGVVRTDTGMQFLEAGYNYRLTNFQAAMGRVQLPHLDSWIARRHELAAIYQLELTKLAEQAKLILPTEHIGHSWQTFMLVLPSGIDRDEVIAQLRERGIEGNLGAQSLSCLNIYQSSINRSEFPVAEMLYKKGLALPFCEQLSEDNIRHVVHSLSEVIL